MISRLLSFILVYFLWITSSTAQFFDDGLTVRDVKNGVNWLRCTVGQTWNYDTEKCEKPKINEKYFPGISPEAYWTQTKNRFNSKMYWTVNFMTGYNYSRFFSYQQLPVLLVQDR